MARVRVNVEGPGMHPSEAIVSINTISGREKMVIDRGAVQGDLLEVGSPVGLSNGNFLVEMPRETSNGHWRLWVSKETIQL